MTSIVEHLKAMNGRDGSPTIFKATYKGHVWHARRITDEICLTRTCRGCWSEHTGGWSPRRHQVEMAITIADVEADYDRIARLRSFGSEFADEVADKQEEQAFRFA